MYQGQWGSSARVLGVILKEAELIVSHVSCVFKDTIYVKDKKQGYQNNYMSLIRITNTSIICLAACEHFRTSFIKKNRYINTKSNLKLSPVLKHQRLLGECSIIRGNCLVVESQMGHDKSHVLKNCRFGCAICAKSLTQHKPKECSPVHAIGKIYCNILIAVFQY